MVDVRRVTVEVGVNVWFSLVSASNIAGPVNVASSVPVADTLKSFTVGLLVLPIWAVRRRSSILVRV